MLGSATSIARKLGRLLPLVVVAGGLSACTSLDRHEFLSTVSLPTTVSVVDPYTETVLWSKDIPVGCRLMVQFNNPQDIPFVQTSERPATKLDWELCDGEHPISGTWTKEPIGKGEAKLPGTPVILKVSYRPAPEYPAGYKGPATQPSARPSWETSGKAFGY